MKKAFFLCLGLIMLILLLICATAGAAQAATQPAKSADQWVSEGYKVIRGSDMPQSGQDNPGMESFLVLHENVRYLTENEDGGITRNGNTFTCSNYTVAQNGTTYTDNKNNNEEKTLYCIKAGGIYYFGLKVDETNPLGSNGYTVALKQDTMVSVENWDAKTALSAAVATAPFTTDTWMKIPIPIDFDMTVEGVPLYFQGQALICLTHDSSGPIYWEDHTLDLFWELDLDKAGFKTDTKTSGEIRHSIASYQHIEIAWVDIKMTDFLGELDVYFKMHHGIKIGLKTSFEVIDPLYVTLSEDGPTYDAGINSHNCIGDADLGLEVGMGGTALPVIIEEESISAGFGLSIRGTAESERFVPADTKEKWHSCDECTYEEIHARLGPLKAVIDLEFLEPFTFETKTIDFDPFADWHYSKTWDEWGDGHCGRYSYRLNTTVVNQEGTPIKGAGVTWSADAHYKPQASGNTNAAGETVIYVAEGEQNITAEVTSLIDPSGSVSKTVKLQKKAAVEDLIITLDIPEKHVWFRNPASGAVTDWPEDITFMPLLSDHVKLPGYIPLMSGFQFIYWNTQSDGRGTSYMPGQTVVTDDDLTLWAQWRLAGNEWYILYDANGATDAPPTQVVPLGTGAFVSRQIPAGGSLIFKGWTTNPFKPEPEYQPGDYIAYNPGKRLVVLHALWEMPPIRRPVHVTYDANGVKGVNLPADLWFPQHSWTHVGWAEAPLDSTRVFIGWSEDPNARRPEYRPGYAYYFDRDATLYAVWGARYKVIYGAGSVWVKGSGVRQRFIANGDLKDFMELRVDGTRLKDGVEISSGSTIADISAETMEKLAPGKHTILFVYKDGQASAEFTVKGKLPPTGDTGHPGLWLCMLLAGLIGCGWLGLQARRAKRNRR